MAQKSIPATAPRSPAPQNPPAATRRTPSKATTRRRVAWRAGRVSPAVAFPILYVLALALARLVVLASPAADVVTDGLSLPAALAAFLAAAAWLAALVIYARWIWRRFMSMGRRPWRVAVVCALLTLAGALWLLMARAGFISRLGFQTFDHQLPFYASTPSIHLTALAGVAAVAALGAACRNR